ncbi:sterol regulatory element-binding transcription factor 1 [Microdochium nivale]|nr:sterol regulatory element-binding transcription factor 1 [Microdochium nivale]
MSLLKQQDPGSLLSSHYALSKLGYPISPPSESQYSFDGGSMGEHSEETTNNNTSSHKIRRRKTPKCSTAEAASRRRPGTNMPDVGPGSDARSNTSGATEPASDEISVRRERGKLAQRAFRQRQIDMIRILKDENAKLKESILNISTAAYKSQRELKDAIAEACRIAELNPSASVRDGSPGQGEDDFEQHDSVVTTQSPRPASAHPHLSSSPFGQFNPGSSPWTSAPLELRSQYASDPQPGLIGHSLYGFEPTHNQGYVNSHADHFASSMGHGSTMPMNGMRNASIASFSSVYSHGFSETTPRGASPDMTAFDQSVHSSVFTHSSPTRAEASLTPSQLHTPEDILPYLGARAYTVAGQVHWASLGYAWQVLRTLEMSYPNPSSEILGTVYGLFHIDATNPQSVSVVKDHLYRRLAFRKQRLSVKAGETPSQQQHSSQHHLQQLNPSPALLRDRSMGSISSNNTIMDNMSSMSSVTPPARHATAATLMSMDTLMSNSASLAGLDPSAYMPPAAVEEQLRHMLGASFLDLEASLRSGVNVANSNGVSTIKSNSNAPQPSPPTPATSSGRGGGRMPAAKQVLHTLASQVIFLADGPRWHPETVANAASVWSVGWQ